MIYFDHAASTPLIPKVLESLNLFEKENYANPSAIHALGAELSRQIDQIRSQFLTKFPIANGQVIFTNSATEANNQFIQSLDKPIYYHEGDHPSVVKTVEVFHQKNSRALPVLEYGAIDLTELKKILETLENSQTCFVLTHINNLTGRVNPIRVITELIRSSSSKHIIFVDCAQSAGKYELDFCDQVDGISIAAHKMGGPKGIAALVYNKNIKLKSLLYGGEHEYDLRASTLATPLIKAFGLALSETQKQTHELVDVVTFLKSELQKIDPKVIFPIEQSSDFILSIIVPDISSDIIVRHLSDHQVYTSQSSACSSKIKKMNPQVLGNKIPVKLQKNLLRLSFGYKTNLIEAKKFIEVYGHFFQENSFLFRK